MRKSGGNLLKQRMEVIAMVMLMVWLFPVGVTWVGVDSMVSAEENRVESVDGEEPEKGGELPLRVIGLIILTILGIFFAPLIIYFISKWVKEVRSKVREHSRERKINQEETERQKQIGYQSYKNLSDLVELFSSMQSDMLMFGTPSEGDKARDGIIRKLDEIRGSYEMDTEKSGVKMYKYENAFKEIEKTVKRAEIKGQKNNVDVYVVIEEAIKYPYEDIVGSGIEGIVGGLKGEIGILKGLKKYKGKN